MQNFIIKVALMFSIASLIGCSTSNTNQSKVGTLSPSPQYQSQGDTYKIEYQVCTPDCMKFSVITWSKPTEIGILYPTFKFKAVEGWTIPLKKLPNPSAIDLYGVPNFVVFKSKGTLPALSSPLKNEVFSPGGVERNLFPQALFANNVDKYLGKPGMQLQITSIKKMPISIEESLVKNGEGLLEKGGSLARASDEIHTFYYQVKKTPGTDLAPQQREKITWQEGQPPQIIPIKKW